MNLRVIESRVEHAALLLGAALHGYLVERACPLVVCLLGSGIEVESLLLLVEVFAGVGYGHEAHAYLHLHLFAFLTVVGHIVADVVASHVASVAGIELILALIFVPLLLRIAEVGLLLPHSVCSWLLVYAYHEVHREDSLRVVAERAEHTRALKLRVADAAQ